MIAFSPKGPAGLSSPSACRVAPAQAPQKREGIARRLPGTWLGPLGSGKDRRRRGTRLHLARSRRPGLDPSAPAAPGGPESGCPGARPIHPKEAAEDRSHPSRCCEGSGGVHHTRIHHLGVRLVTISTPVQHPLARLRTEGRKPKQVDARIRKLPRAIPTKSTLSVSSLIEVSMLAKMEALGISPHVSKNASMLRPGIDESTMEASSLRVRYKVSCNVVQDASLATRNKAEAVMGIPCRRQAGVDQWMLMLLITKPVEQRPESKDLRGRFFRTYDLQSMSMQCSVWKALRIQLH